VFESMMEGRSQQAQRFITEYLKLHTVENKLAD
jgi:hypothetical protein